MMRLKARGICLKLASAAVVLGISISRGVLGQEVWQSGTVNIKPVYISSKDASTLSSEERSTIAARMQDNVDYANSVFSQIGLSIVSAPAVIASSYKSGAALPKGQTMDELRELLKWYDAEIGGESIPVIYVDNLLGVFDNLSGKAIPENTAKAKGYARGGIFLNYQNTGWNRYYNYKGPSFDALPHEIGHMLINGYPFRNSLDEGVHVNSMKQLMHDGQKRRLPDALGSLNYPYGSGYDEIHYDVINSKNFPSSQVEAMYSNSSFVNSIEGDSWGVTLNFGPLFPPAKEGTQGESMGISFKKEISKNYQVDGKDLKFGKPLPTQIKCVTTSLSILSGMTTEESAIADAQCSAFSRMENAASMEICLEIKSRDFPAW